MIKITCEQCGVEFSVKPYRATNAKYCSMRCMGLARQGIQRDHLRVSRKCEVCGIEFDVVPSVVKIGRGRFCSRDCYGIWLSKNNVAGNHPNWRGGEMLRTCQVCGAEFYAKKAIVSKGNGKFCSWECQHKGHKTSPRTAVTQCVCEICGKVFERSNWEVQNKNAGRCCSRKCLGEWRSQHIYGENHPNWRGGPLSYPRGWREKLRNQIRSYSGYACALCGKEDADRELSIHHIDYNRNNLGDTNLIALCVRCHTRTNYNRSYWQTMFQTGNYQF